MPLPIPPLTSAAVVSKDRLHPFAAKLPMLVLSRELSEYLLSLADQIDRSPVRLQHVRLTGQTASIATTAIPLATIAPGIWRVSYHVRVTTSGTVSSSIQVTLHWTDGAVTQSEAGAALVGNLTTTREGVSRILRVDESTPISYSTTYASVGATPMAYALDLVAEELGIDTV